MAPTTVRLVSSDPGDRQSSSSLFDPLEEARKTITPTAKLCGNCLLWRPNIQDAQGRWVGPCRLQPGRGDLPPTAAACERFLVRGSKIPTTAPPEPSRRSRTIVSSGPIHRRGSTTLGTIAPSPSRPDEEIGDILAMTRNELIEIIQEAMGEGDTPPLANKWEGGSIVLKPANPDLQPREIPLESLFRKVVMIRDRLRVLEAKVNGHSKMTDGEKVELQSYITRCYGSLTTFNVLFRDKSDFFVGDKGKEN